MHNIYDDLIKYQANRYCIVFSSFLSDYSYLSGENYYLKVFFRKSTLIFRDNASNYKPSSSDKVGVILSTATQVFDNYIHIKASNVTTTYSNLLFFDLDISSSETTLTENYYSDSYNNFNSSNSSIGTGFWGVEIYINE